MGNIIYIVCFRAEYCTCKLKLCQYICYALGNLRLTNSKQPGLASRRHRRDKFIMEEEGD